MYLIDFSSLDNVRELAGACHSAAIFWQNHTMLEIERKFAELEMAGATEASFSDDELKQIAFSFAGMTDTWPYLGEWARFFYDELHAIRLVNAA